MVILAYNLSSNLQDYIKKIESLRRDLLVIPLSPKSELRIKWEAVLDKVYWSLVLTNNSLSKKAMTKLLSNQKKQLSKEEKEVVNYKKALDYIKNEWQVTDKSINSKVIKRLYDIACKPTDGAAGNEFESTKKELDQFLTYLETGTEHPIIQAGIAEIQMIGLAPFKKGNGRVARLIPYLFLYKAGYNFRDMVVLDEYLRRDVITLKGAIESVQKTRNLTLWLEYFAFGIFDQLRKAIKKAQTTKFSSEIPASFFNLNKRQKAILESLESPAAKITNKDVQKEFGISQITASRDLTKLVSMNLLFPHGKGRSTYYTKI